MGRDTAPRLVTGEEALSISDGRGPDRIRAAARARSCGAERVGADRIFVREHVRAVEIGAFSAESGVAQRVRFDVVLEVRNPAADTADDVDTILSYDTIIEAIDAALAEERVNLLETLAERIAERCLCDPRALRSFVRVEKLDRVPGALGVEIVRMPSARLPRICAGSEPYPRVAKPPLVLHLPRPVLSGPRGQAWLDAAARHPSNPLLVVDPAESQGPSRSEASLRAGLLAMEQAAWALAAQDSRFGVAASRAEIAWAGRLGQPAIWAPSKLVLDSVPRPEQDASEPIALARWLASRLGAPGLHVVADDEAPGCIRLDPSAPERLAECA